MNRTSWEDRDITKYIEYWMRPERDNRCFQNSKDDLNELSEDRGILYTNRRNKKSGKRSAPVSLMPDIKDVDIVGNDKSKIVKVFFADGTMEKAVQSAGDEFSFDVGIDICLHKKLLSMFSGGQGTALCNKLNARAHKVYERKLKDAAKTAEDEIKKKERYLKQIEKKKQKRERKEAEAREKIIDILASAIAKAKEITS